MQLKRLREAQEDLAWPSENSDLPVIGWADYQKQSETRALVLISGFIHDVSSFLDQHPGGAHLLLKFVGKDATAAFFGGVYEHSNAGHNLLAMKRVGVLHGGHPHISDDSGKPVPRGISYYSASDSEREKIIPPSQRLRITRFSELGWTSGSQQSGAESD